MPTGYTYGIVDGEQLNIVSINANAKCKKRFNDF